MGNQIKPHLQLTSLELLGQLKAEPGILQEGVYFGRGHFKQEFVELFFISRGRSFSSYYDQSLKIQDFKHF